jgi:hypothetical protein
MAVQHSTAALSGLLDIGSAREFDSLNQFQNALVFGTYTAVALTIGAVTLRHRDIP